MPLAALLASAAVTPVSAATITRSDGIYVRCDQCGVVQSIEHNVVQGRDHGTAGAVIGAIAGGVLGNQVGRGNGRKLATVGGAVAGGATGRYIQGQRQQANGNRVVETVCKRY
ncbi:MAG: glycine zipper 2TM domain-containing protein [Xanthomonas sp.]